MSERLTEEQLTGIDMSAACGDFGDPEQFHAMTDEIREGRDRISTLERELAKADRRTAEQEGIIAKQRAKLAALRDALTEALDNWASWYEDQRVGSMPLEDARIVELRKLTEATLERAVGLANRETPGSSALDLDRRDVVARAARKAIADAVPVLEVATALALSTTDGEMPAALYDVIRAFGGGGPEGIERARDHLVELRAIVGAVPTAVPCRGCDDVRATSCGAEDCPIPLQVAGDLDTPVAAPRFIKPTPYVVPAADLRGFSAGVLCIAWKHPAESFEIAGRTGRLHMAVVVDCRTRSGTLDRAAANATLIGAVIRSPDGVLRRIVGVEAHCTMRTWFGDPLGLLLVPVEEP